MLLVATETVKQLIIYHCQHLLDVKQQSSTFSAVSIKFSVTNENCYCCTSDVGNCQETRSGIPSYKKLAKINYTETT